MSIKILDPGVQSLLQDSGRNGYARFGVPPSGAFDMRSWRIANHIVGNAVHDTGEQRSGPAAIELLLGGLRLEATEDTSVAVVGAHVDVIRLSGYGDEKHSEQTGHPITLTAGSRLHVGRALRGLRLYIAVAGGFQPEMALGSASTDTVSRLGPNPLVKGDLLRVGIGSHSRSPSASLLAAPPATDGPLGIRIAWAVDSEGFGRTNAELLGANPWTVSPTSNRAGVRLYRDGGNQTKIHGDHEHRDGRSMPMHPGAVQALPNGELVIIGPDGPTTGGYPVVGVVDRDSLDSIAQARPGSTLELLAVGS